MKALVFSICLLLTACDTTPILNGSSVAQTAGISDQATKSLTVAHQSYNAVGQALIQAAESGVLKGAAAKQAKALFNKAGDALAVADTAYRASNETNLLRAISEANSAIAQAKTLAGVR